MFALYVLPVFAAAGDRLFLPIANLQGQQPLTQASETVHVPLNQAWAETPQLAVPQGYYVEAVPQQDRSVPMSWAFTGAFLVAFGATYAARVATLGTGGSSMPSRRAAVLSAASLLAVPLAAQAKPEDYVGGYTTKMYEKTYAAGKPKCFSSGAGAPDICAGPGGSPKDPLINPNNPTRSVPTKKKEPPAETTEKK
jgi:hypothetical protein